ncbi:MAG: TraB/GumN family protein, partial [Cyanothece sp. SIO1E1]|nr:TraB/GumN family protein [Cyanothece sp. SIO1E1]
MKYPSRLTAVGAIAVKRLTQVLLVSVVTFTTVSCIAESTQLPQETEDPQLAQASDPQLAQDSQLAQTLESTQAPEIFLWQVESPTNTLYLLGSVHILQAADYPLPQPMQAAFDQAEKLVFEVDLAELETSSTQTLILQKAAPDQNETLRTSLTPETYQLAQRKAAEIGLPIAAFDSFEPWFFVLSLVTLKLQSLG